MSGRGWALVRAIALSLAVVSLAPLDPLVLVTVPLAIMLLAHKRVNAFGVAMAALILLLAFSGLTDEPGPLWYVGRAWAVVLGGCFVATGLVARSARPLARSIAAVGLAFVFFVLAGLTRPDLLAEVDWWIRARLESAALGAYQIIAAGGESWERLGSAYQDMLEIQLAVYPALLALASLAALAVAWYIVERLAGVTDTLGSLKEFRFADQLVWLLIVGLVLFLLPIPDSVARMGQNAVTFMGALYLLRGAGILLWLVAAAVSSVWWGIVWALLAIVAYPVVAGAALVVGLSDTWLDLRTRLRASSEGEQS